MFDDLADYLVAAATLYVGFCVGTAIFKASSEAYEEIKTMNEESSNKWDSWTLGRYEHLSKKLDETNASRQARLEAHEHASMLIEKHLEFYVVNPVAREKALAFNQKYIQSIRGF